MRLKVDTKLNARQTVSMEIEGKMDECLRGANAMLAFKGVCGLCKGNDILLQTKVAKGFNFIEFVCPKCGAKAQWGQYKEGGYFLKQWEVYDRGTPKVANTEEPPLEESPF